MRVLSAALFAGCLHCPLGNAGQAERPAALDRMVAARAALHTGRLDLLRTDNTTSNPARRPRMVSKSVRFAGDHLIWTDHGDEDGVVVYNVDGKPDDRRPRYAYYAPGTAYLRSEDRLKQVLAFRRDARSIDDVRSLGVGAGPYKRDVFDLVWRDDAANPAAPQYKEWEEDGFAVVRARRNSVSVTYWIDPQRGWQPVRVREENARYGTWAESRSALELKDGVWFPTAVEFYKSSFRSGNEPVEVVSVVSAEFNHPEHPQELTLEDFGLEPGMNVTLSEKGKQPFYGRWDGEDVISEEAFRGKLHSGELKEGEDYKRAIARLSSVDAETARRATDGEEKADVALLATVRLETLEAMMNTSSKHALALWEAYVRRFIQVYRLNAEQSEKALAILHDCQQRAAAVVKRHAPTLEKLKRRAEQASATGNKPDERAAEASKNARQQRDDAIQGIFDKQLKPRLEKLPTRAQRDAAEKARATPAATP